MPRSRVAVRSVRPSSATTRWRVTRQSRGASANPPRSDRPPRRHRRAGTADASPDRRRPLARSRQRRQRPPRRRPRHIQRRRDLAHRRRPSARQHRDQALLERPLGLRHVEHLPQVRAGEHLAVVGGVQSRVTPVISAAGTHRSPVWVALSGWRRSPAPRPSGRRGRPRRADRPNEHGSRGHVRR
jgi:hypothetical protein